MTLRERALLILGAVLSPGDHRYRQVLEFLPPQYSAKSYYALLRRMETDGVILRSSAALVPTIRLRPAGLDRLIQRYGHWGLMRKPWDGVWRIALYDVPENQRYTREKIRHILRRFGYGAFQQSVYISPFDTVDGLKHQLAQEGLLDTVMLLSASPDQLGDSKRVAERVWRLRSIEEGYLGFLRRLQIVKGQQLASKRVAGIRRIRSEFVELAGQDPFLPGELLPTEWSFERVRMTLAK